MPPQKRKVSEAAIGARRSSRRTSTKSQYFADDSDGLNKDEDDAIEPPAKKKRGRPPKQQAKKETKKQIKKKPESEDSDEAYEDDKPKQDEAKVEDDGDSDDSDAPPKVTFIPLPKLLDEGGIPYEDSRLHPNTMEFLKLLKANNRRPWLKSHDPEYRRALKDWESFILSTTDTVIEVDETIPELPVKDINFRIYRDARFSKDPTPYKPHFGAAWSRTGRKGPYACYYVHCEPGSAFVGGGIWCPAWDKLLNLRASVDRRSKGWRRVLNDPDFKRVFLPKLKSGADEKAALKAFAEENKEGALTLAPSGYPRDHPDIELLRLKNFTVRKKIPDDIFTSDDGQEKLADIMRAMSKFVTFLNSIVMPDPDDDNEDEDDEDEEQEEEEAGGDEDEE